MSQRMPSLVVVAPSSPLLTRVQEMWGVHRSTLGYLPEGAEYAFDFPLIRVMRLAHVEERSANPFSRGAHCGGNTFCSSGGCGGRRGKVWDRPTGDESSVDCGGRARR